MDEQKLQMTLAHQERAMESLRADLNILQNDVQVLALALANVVRRFPELAQDVEKHIEAVRDRKAFAGHSKLFFATQVPPK